MDDFTKWEAELGETMNNLASILDRDTDGDLVPGAGPFDWERDPDWRTGLTQSGVEDPTLDSGISISSTAAPPASGRANAYKPAASRRYADPNAYGSAGWYSTLDEACAEPPEEILEDGMSIRDFVWTYLFLCGFTAVVFAFLFTIGRV